MDAKKSQGKNVSSTEFCVVYTTAPDYQVAKDISQKLVEQKLVACANIFAQMTSVYAWEGKIEATKEVSIVLKTQQALVAKLEAKVKELHPYATPCLVVLPIVGGSDEYLSWIRSETLDLGPS